MPDRPTVSGASGPSIKDMVERISMANDTAKLIEALRIAANALAWYASEKNWSEDDWGIRAVISPPDYSSDRPGGQKARNAIKRIERVTRPGYVAKTLRPLGEEDS